MISCLSDIIVMSMPENCNESDIVPPSTDLVDQEVLNSSDLKTLFTFNNKRKRLRHEKDEISISNVNNTRDKTFAENSTKGASWFDFNSIPQILEQSFKSGSISSGEDVLCDVIEKYFNTDLGEKADKKNSRMHLREVLLFDLFKRTIDITKDVTVKLFLAKEMMQTEIKFNIYLQIVCCKRSIFIQNPNEFIHDTLQLSLPKLWQQVHKHMMNNEMLTKDRVKIEVRREKVGDFWIVLKEESTPMLYNVNMSSIVLSKYTWDKLIESREELSHTLIVLRKLKATCMFFIEKVKCDVKSRVINKCKQNKNFKNNRQKYLKWIETQVLQQANKHHKEIICNGYEDPIAQIHQIIQNELSFQIDLELKEHGYFYGM
jgi:hypothetical protein